MSRCSPWGVALLIFAFVAGQGLAQDKDKKDAAAKDAAAKDAAKKDDAKKDDPKKDDAKKPDPKMPAPAVPDKKEAEKKLIKTQSIVGEIVHIEPNKQAFRVKVTYQYSELNAGAYQNLIAGQRELAVAKDANQYRAALQKIAQYQGKLYDMKSTSKEFQIDGAENLKVRLAAPKAGFDDMGNLKKYTMKELAAMRGPDKLFDGEFSDLTVGQIAQVTIVVPKPPAKPVRKDDLTLQEDPKIEATRIVIARQPAPAKP